ncbi:MAG: insulinase family protein [Marinomonas sp.]
MIQIIKKLIPFFALLTALASFPILADEVKVSTNPETDKSMSQNNTDHTPLTPTVTVIPNKSLTDQNSYYTITLPNHLKVILINDPQAERFSASLSVNVGSFNDPKDQQGLAHFLEHMLFLGTEKYPESGNYQSYISTHGGTHNAYTSTDTTNFFFDIKPSGYEGAIDRFAQFFISPLFSESLTQREKNAVDAEYKAKFKNESRRNNQAFKTLINQDHPYNRFTVGNLDTLKDRPNNPLREQLLSLYKANYYAENMALVMVANLSYEEMARLATEYFSDIKSQSAPIQNTSDEISLQSEQVQPEQIQLEQTEPVQALPPTLIPINKPHLQFIRPLIDKDTLYLYYQIDAQLLNYKTQPTRYLSYILGNENKGSLYASLKSEGLINSISASTSSDYVSNAFFTVKMRLTEAGMEKIDTVAQRFFATINLLRSSPINPIYLEEGLKLSQMMFNHQSYVHPQSLARALSAKALKVPTEDLLSSFRIDEMASKEDISHLLQQLNTENLLIQVTSNKEMPNHWAKDTPEWQIEPWYQSEYSNNFFSQPFINLMNLAVKSTLVTLPERNNFIPESLTMIDEQDEAPSLVFQKEGFSYWHKSDSSFHKPTAMNFLALRFDNAADTAKNTLLNRLWSRLFNESVSEYTYSPYLAGLGFNFYPHVNGVTLRTNGYSDKQNNYLIWLIDQLFLFRPKFDRFELAKQQLQKDLSNQTSKQAYQGANSALNTLITKNSFNTKQLEESLATISLSDLQEFTKNARNNFSVVGYSTGNLTKEQTGKLANTLYERFDGRLADREGISIQTKTLPTQQKLHHQFDSSSDDSAVLYALIDTSTQELEDDETITQKAYFSIMRKIINSPFYQDLRTNQQLGYIVGTQDLSTRNTPILGLVIQSPNKDTLTLVNAIDTFLSEQRSRLSTLAEEDFDAAKSTLLNQLKIQAKNLSDNALSEWRQIAQKEPNFDFDEEWIKAVEAIQKEDFIQFMEKKLDSIDSTRIVIHNKAFPPELTDWLPAKTLDYDNKPKPQHDETTRIEESSTAN